jgi:hypothetical protein
LADEDATRTGAARDADCVDMLQRIRPQPGNRLHPDVVDGLSKNCAPFDAIVTGCSPAELNSGKRETRIASSAAPFTAPGDEWMQFRFECPAGLDVQVKMFLNR